MSNLANEIILEDLFLEFLEEGHSEAEAERLANETLETIPSPWG